MVTTLSLGYVISYNPIGDKAMIITKPFLHFATFNKDFDLYSEQGAFYVRNTATKCLEAYAGNGHWIARLDTEEYMHNTDFPHTLVQVSTEEKPDPIFVSATVAIAALKNISKSRSFPILESMCVNELPGDGNCLTGITTDLENTQTYNLTEPTDEDAFSKLTTWIKFYDNGFKSGATSIHLSVDYVALFCAMAKKIFNTKKMSVQIELAQNNEKAVRFSCSHDEMNLTFWLMPIIVNLG